MCFKEIWREERRRTDLVLWRKPLHPQKNKKATWQHKNATKNYDNTMTAERLRTVSWSNGSHPTSVKKSNPTNKIGWSSMYPRKRGNYETCWKLPLNAVASPKLDEARCQKECKSFLTRRKWSMRPFQMRLNLTVKCSKTVINKWYVWATEGFTDFGPENDITFVKGDLTIILFHWIFVSKMSRGVRLQF